MRTQDHLPCPPHHRCVGIGNKVRKPSLFGLAVRVCVYVLCVLSVVVYGCMRVCLFHLSIGVCVGTMMVRCIDFRLARLGTPVPHAVPPSRPLPLQFVCVFVRRCLVLLGNCTAMQL